MTEIVPIESIVSKIILLRGEKVLLDRDLAKLYEVETKVLKQAVRRNIDVFLRTLCLNCPKKNLRIGGHSL